MAAPTGHGKTMKIIKCVHGLRIMEEIIEWLESFAVSFGPLLEIALLDDESPSR